MTKSLTGHVTERMREHYSTIGFDEKQAAIANVVRLIHAVPTATSGNKVGTEVGTESQTETPGV